MRDQCLGCGVWLFLLNEPSPRRLPSFPQRLGRRAHRLRLIELDHLHAADRAGITQNLIGDGAVLNARGFDRRELVGEHRKGRGSDVRSVNVQRPELRQQSELSEPVGADLTAVDKDPLDFGKLNDESQGFVVRIRFRVTIRTVAQPDCGHVTVELHRERRDVDLLGRQLLDDGVAVFRHRAGSGAFVRGAYNQN